MQIKEIFLYNHTGALRQIPFRLGAVNILTGKSKSGKSSLIDIIEYCLGKDSCEVADGVIRDKCSWYGLILKFSDCEAIIARRNPPVGFGTSSDIFLNTASSVSIPAFATLKGTINSDSLRDFLSDRIGIRENMVEVPDGQTRPPIVAELKHALIYCFQEQDEITSKSFLFHRQAEPFLPQMIKDTLPFFLGAIPQQRLAKLTELRLKRAELVVLERQEKEAISILGRGLSRAVSLLEEAAVLGMISDIPDETKVGLDELCLLLKSIVLYKPEMMIPQSSERLHELRAEYLKLLSEIQRANEELRYAQHFETDQLKFSDEASAQGFRLQSIKLYSEPNAGTCNECPVCERPFDENSLPKAEWFTTAIDGLEKMLAGVGREKPRLRGFIGNLQKSLNDKKLRLETVDSIIRDLENQDIKIKSWNDQEQKRSRVIGRISLYLESIDQLNISRADQGRLKELRDQVKSLEKEIESFDLNESKTAIGALLGARMSPYAQYLQLEHSNKMLQLDLSKLTVVAYSSETATPLNRMGSAENHLGYHLVSHIALHEWFVEKSLPVPRFLFLDQPTQAYYPPDKDQNGSIEGLRSEDQLAVNRIFQWLLERIRSLDGRLQLLIADHADIQEQWFQDCVVHRWRGEDALIPKEWITQD